MKRLDTEEATAQKKYLSIGEVAAKFSISVEVLRKWEHDFPGVLRPKRTGGETRLYDAKQVEKVSMIYQLLRVEGLTIEGARKRLSNKQTDEEQRQEVITKLTGVRNQLQSIVDEISKIEQQNGQQRPFKIIYNN